MGFMNWISGMATSAGERITARELLARLKSGPKLLVVDVREPMELRQLPALAGARNVPMSELGQRLAEIPKDRPVALICRSGGRSLQAMFFLKNHGYTQLLNVEGGLLAVSAESRR